MHLTNYAINKLSEVRAAVSQQDGCGPASQPSGSLGFVCLPAGLRARRGRGPRVEALALVGDGDDEGQGKTSTLPCYTTCSHSQTSLLAGAVHIRVMVRSSLIQYRLCFFLLARPSQGCDTRLLWRRMCDMIIRTLLSVQPALAEAYRCFFGATSRRPTGKAALSQLGLDQAKLSACFEILGFDVIVSHHRVCRRCRGRRLETNCPRWPLKTLPATDAVRAFNERAIQCPLGPRRWTRTSVRGCWR